MDTDTLSSSRARTWNVIQLIYCQFDILMKLWLLGTNDCLNLSWMSQIKECLFPKNSQNVAVFVQLSVHTSEHVIYTMLFYKGIEEI